MKAIKNVLIILFMINTVATFAQRNFSVEIEETSVNGMPAVHSGTVVTLNGKWLFIGGRSAGLHGFQPPFAFPTSGRNEMIYVVDPTTNQTWSSSANTLVDSIFEAVCSSNMQYTLQGDTLIMIGGYGWKNTANDFVTFPTLTIIDAAGLMNAVINSQNINSFFRQSTDQRMAVCGTHLFKIGNTFYFPFGQRFDGIYSQINGGGGFFTQHYTGAISTFQITDNGGNNIAVNNFLQTTDTINFHRRDLNVALQIFPNGSTGLTAFGGVFQPTINLPYFTPIDIQPSSYSVSTWTQKYADYHCAVMPVYDSANHFMHTEFFGGMSEFYPDSLGATLLQDTAVPFVKTISRISRDPSSQFTEITESQKMPGYLGTNATFLPLNGIALTQNQIIKLDPISGRTQVGWIVGGIESPMANISQIDPGLSFASNRVFKVFINTDTLTSVAQNQPQLPVQISVSPNPSKNIFEFNIESSLHEPLILSVYNANGVLIQTLYNNLFTDTNMLLKWNSKNFPTGIYNYILYNGKYKLSGLLIKNQ